ncbi:hypothetical protein GCM10025868_24440 [Angustibacter aerolatus]|uniref:Acyltransferase 3 domain-containing protein n=1 Tax=Angustibacter aerolatus TaxID=1162965 RepID=A0ABQ6JHA3_9ACTN|nr:acyltransferase [Angustibacter aerolatus]GMA87194.1 hypothetical protein GCM10025868_24440 [Angustibacter aerolatus]
MTTTAPSPEVLDDGTRRVRPPRLAALDGLRFVAALAVVLYHFTGIRSTHWGTTDPTPFGPLSAVTRYGFLGVPLFFFISGFVILMTAWGRDVPHFAASRVGRLFPAYWAGVLLTGALLLVTGHEPEAHRCAVGGGQPDHGAAGVRRRARRRRVLDALGRACGSTC